MTRTLRPDGLPQPSTAFEAAVVDFVVDLFDANPVWGTAVGFHVVDDRWPDLSEAGRQARLAMYARHRERFEAFDEAELDREAQVDRRILLERLDAAVFGDDVLRSEAWDPLDTVYLLGSGIFGVLMREYAPWSERGAALVARIEAMPAVIADALAGLTGLPGRPVALLQLETALPQLAGITSLVDASVAEARTRAEAGEAAELVEPLQVAASAANEAVSAFGTALDTEVRPRAEGDGRLGQELFAQKLRMTLGSGITPEQLRERAWRDFHAVRAEMLAIARERWADWIPGERMPAVATGDTAGESALVKRVLDAIAEQHQEPAGLISYCEAEMDRIAAFCRERDIISLPDDPLSITWTPVFMRPYGRAFLDHPGPLDRGEKSYFWITPPDESEGPEAVASYLREENDAMLRDLSIHEGIPGHYLQLAASNHCESLTRTVFFDGMFAEGWAVYVTQVMVDRGYASDDPGFALTHWKLYLRAVTNAILDVETHTGGMTEEQAMELMVGQAFQEADEARGKWLRARISSTQLSTYYVGAVEMWEIEEEARRRAATAAGGSVDDIPPQHVAGGFDATPGFDPKAHLEAVISHGTPPVRWARTLVLGDALPPLENA